MQIMQARYESLKIAIDGYQQSQMPLVAISNEVYKPAGLGEDLGSFYFIPKLAYLFGLSLDASIDLFYTGIVLLAFIAGVIGAWRYCKTISGKWIGLFALMLLSGIIWVTGDAYVVLGTTAVALVPWWLYLKERSFTKWHLVYCGFAGFVIGIAHFIRGHAGTGVLLFLLLSLMFTKGYNWRYKVGCVAILLAAMLTVFLYFGHLLQQRDAYLTDLYPTYKRPLAKHPFWYSVYIGFGFLNNPYGIVYADKTALNKISSVYPNMGYLVPEYEAILRYEVFKFIKTHPYFTLRTIFAKLGVVLMQLLIFANFGVLFAVLYPRGWRFELPFVSGMAFNALFGIMVMPIHSYILGLLAFATLYGIFHIDNAIQRGVLRYLKQKLPILNLW